MSKKTNNDPQNIEIESSQLENLIWLSSLLILSVPNENH